MEGNEKRLLEDAVKNSSAIRRLYERHRNLDRKIASFGIKRFLTHNEQFEIARLKKEKLLGKDQLLSMLNDWKSKGNKVRQRGAVS